MVHRRHTPARFLFSNTIGKRSRIIPRDLHRTTKARGLTSFHILSAGVHLTPVYFACVRDDYGGGVESRSPSSVLSKRAPDYIGGLRASICCRVPGSYYVPPSITRGINAPDGTRVFPERGKTIGNSQDTCPYARECALVSVHCPFAGRSTTSGNGTE